MSYVLEVDTNRNLKTRVKDGDIFAEYDGLFKEEDFIAMGLNPSSPTGAKPGSDDKVLMLAARYAVGLPLWHDEDCYDHGPGDMLDDEN